eukprot:TRINITY_DN19608_c0_g1_i20.p2 TRINITY_DN19608_c0_g1~~TRINITY_DN19608_c0_g1_i20.p2  ORF type:complete len:206 (+),score=52.68 TRINITY_DN19608_c0_g1_i20:56-673(+)
MFARLAVLLLAVGAAGCKFGACPEGCTPEYTYTPDPKTNTARCRKLLDVVQIDAPAFHSCHANVQEPRISTPDVCTEFLGLTVCLKKGTCAVTRKMDVMGMKCHCPLKEGDLCFSFCEDGSCSLNRKEDCPAGTTCRGVDDGRFHFNSYLYCLPECPAGEEYDQLAGKCVAVTCDAKGACPAGTKCVPNDGIACVRAPCPRFECQ